MTLLPLLVLQAAQTAQGSQAAPLQPPSLEDLDFNRNVRFLPPGVPRPSDAEVRFVRGFLREAYVGTDPNVVLRPYEYERTATIDSSDVAQWGWRTYTFGSSTIYILVPSGRIRTYSGPYGSTKSSHDANGAIEPRAVSDREAVALARRFYAAAGYAGEFLVDAVEDLPNGNPVVEVRLTPSVGGVPYQGQFRVDVDRQTGRLIFFSSPGNFLAPPASTVPAFSLESAKATALRAGIDLRGEALSAELPPKGSPRDAFRLFIWEPPELTKAGGSPFWGFALRDTPGVREARRDKHGLLAYAGWLFGGDPRSTVRVILDAQTGEVLATQEPIPPGSTGGGGGGAGVKPAALLPSAKPRPWRVAVGAGGWSAPALATLLPAPATGFVPRRKVALTDGRLALPATFDPKSGLVGVTAKGRLLATYRPGPALANLLRRTASTP